MRAPGRLGAGVLCAGIPVVTHRRYVRTGAVPIAPVIGAGQTVIAGDCVDAAGDRIAGIDGAALAVVAHNRCAHAAGDRVTGDEDTGIPVAAGNRDVDAPCYRVAEVVGASVPVLAGRQARAPGRPARVRGARVAVIAEDPRVGAPGPPKTRVRRAGIPVVAEHQIGRAHV